jgi:hypothetical protein
VKTALTCGFLLPLWYGFGAASRAGEDFFGNQARPLPAHLSHSLQGIAETDREHRCVSGALEFRIRVVIAPSLQLPDLLAP